MVSLALAFPAIPVLQLAPFHRDQVGGALGTPAINFDAPAKYFTYDFVNSLKAFVDYFEKQRRRFAHIHNPLPSQTNAFKRVRVRRLVGLLGGASSASSGFICPFAQSPPDAKYVATTDDFLPPVNKIVDKLKFQPVTLQPEDSATPRRTVFSTPELFVFTPVLYTEAPQLSTTAST